MADPAEPLEWWSVATFDVVLFGLAAVILGHASGELTGVLLGIGTLPGLLAFGYLWALAALAIRWVLSAGGLERCREGELSALASRGAVGGGLVGAAFVVGVVLASGFTALLSGGSNLQAFAYLGLLGGIVGAVVGAVVGTSFALVDVACYRAADLLVPSSGGDEGPDSPDGSRN